MNVNPISWASAALRLLARLDSDGVNSTTPVTEINGGAISATNADIALVAKGRGATLAQVPDGTAAGGNKRGTFYATDLQKSRSNALHVASGNWSSVLGGDSNMASNTYAVVTGGTGNSASGTHTAICGGSANSASSNYSFVGGGASNTAQTNSHATVCGGSTNTASGQYSFVGGGQSNSAVASRSTIGGGNNNTANTIASVISGGSSNTTSAVNATVCGGGNNAASGDYSTVTGGRYGTARGIYGMLVMPACDTPIASSAGVTQSAILILGRQTTDATATVLTSNSIAAGTTNQVILPNNSAYSFSGEVIAGVTGAGNTARWTIDGAIKRGANAASTTMVGTATVTMSHFDVGAAAWVVAVTADTTNGGIKVEVTGAAATTIRWVCRISTVEMTY
jgi:hypothetical protein